MGRRKGHNGSPVSAVQFSRLNFLGVKTGGGGCGNVYLDVCAKNARKRAGRPGPNESFTCVLLEIRLTYKEPTR